jgi:hypothetical protein
LLGAFTRWWRIDHLLGLEEEFVHAS